MKKIKRIILCFFLVFSFTFVGLYLSSCTEQSKEENVVYTLEDVIFEDKVFDYDGEKHSIVVDHLPEGARVDYTNNYQTEPGVYTVVANVVTENKKRRILNAKMTINHLASTLSADASQVALANTLEDRFSYQLNNKEQELHIEVKSNGKVIDTSYIYEKPGTYELEVYAKKSKHYLESNHIKIQLEVKESILGISFENESFVADGSEKQLLLKGELPAGYSVEYKNNTGTTKGKYYALATIKNASGEVIEQHRAILSIDNLDDALFEAYLDDFFVSYLEGDAISINIFCEHPENFSLLRVENPKFYTYSSAFTLEDQKEELEYYSLLLEELEAFDKEKLSNRQMIAYQQIFAFLLDCKASALITDIDYKKLHYVDQFGGYVADFGTYIEAYSLRDELNVKEMISLINSTKEAFSSYVQYVEDRATRGYALSDFTIRSMQDYLKDVLDSQKNGGQYYLVEILTSKIQGLDFLTDLQKTEYCNQVTSGFKDNFMVGVQALFDGLEAQIGKLEADKTGYLAAYEDGADIFVKDLKDLLGLENFDITKYIKEVNDALINTSLELANVQVELYSKYNIKSYTQFEKMLSNAVIFKGTPQEMLTYLKEFSKTIVPDLLTTPNISIKEMDEASAKVSNAVAYYMKSALDNVDQEVITLNPVKLGDTNDVLGTMSHEGYPGHLYAYVYSKQLDIHNISKIMTNTAHAEGWATYVELKLYEYALENSQDEKFIDVMKYLIADHQTKFLFETRVDVGIHYEHWSVNKVASYMDQLGYNSSMAQEIYDLLIETPVSYAAYGYGKYFFMKLHDDAKSILKSAYNEIEFNEMILSKGWINLGELQKLYDEYIKDKCHKFGIES
ncbi:MAG: DUF885 domain-containing protein [Roseburia sp.]|nr:DUF885 domain-containing protein [Anaeroplasma bactoclasticum]MCM1195458.1 DUF885 domain-containing protein [Roseburia sp.]